MPQTNPAPAKPTAMPYAFLLDRIGAELESMARSAKAEDYGRAAYNRTVAVALIEAIEVHNCGSAGGYDAGQTDRSLAGRLAWIKARTKGG